MKSQDPDMYQDGCDFITYSVVLGYLGEKKASPCCEACQRSSVMRQRKFKGSLQISGCICCESIKEHTLYQCPVAQIKKVGMDKGKKTLRAKSVKKE